MGGQGWILMTAGVTFWVAEKVPECGNLCRLGQVNLKLLIGYFLHDNDDDSYYHEDDYDNDEHYS